eukprot:CAMPEP_0116064682 /NCGR_PEP_ID=MMETSP0322-20121206/9269_1 /TAXON_ID=163516 /ORGANISM="Leptocylindrus danicus var. apora, Strain B651" /LENGTH=161 /DNA_ID=CAMNT_0003550765 /DNA_START=213 /DNA_END=698 /DNA_ORIENTATION=+
MVSIKDSPEASSAYQKSCYFEIDFTINDGLPVGEAIKKFSAFDIGALVTVDDSGALTGVISERDIVTKVGLLDKSYDTVIKEVSTQTARLVTATLKDSVDDCMKKLLDKNIRHLPLLNDEGKVIGMLSVKDLVKEMLAEREETIEMLENFALGKGGTVEYS